MRSLLLALLMLAMSAPCARAHAPAETRQIVSRTPSAIVLATNRGLIFGDPQRRAFSLLCNVALGLGTSEEYRVAELDDATLIVASSRGMQRSRDRGCSFQPIEALTGLSTPTLVQHPTDRQRLFATSYGSGQPGKAAVLASDDGGELWRTLYAAGENDYLNSLLVIPGEPLQLYVSAIVIGVASEPYSYYTARSRDGGATWTKSALTLAAEELDLTLLAANPARPDELLARATASEPQQGERLLWSRDGGQTWSSPLELRALRTAVFSPDGSAAFVAGVEGIQRATDEARSFAAFSSAERISQLDYDEGRLVASGYYAGIAAALDGVAIAAPGSSQFDRWLHFNEVSAPVHCPPPSKVDEECGELWRDWKIENPPPRELTDAGFDAAVEPIRDAALILDAGLDASSSVAPMEASGGCALRSPQSTQAVLVILLLFLRRRARSITRTAVPWIRHSRVFVRKRQTSALTDESNSLSAKAGRDTQQTTVQWRDDA
jgi:photosystem II stability/assembly factor-like uncharacterized protein